MEITIAHWAYVFGALWIIYTMLRKKSVVVPTILASFLVALAYTGNIAKGLQTIFYASFVAATELFDVFLIIAIMTALLWALKDIQADVKMIEPFQKWMKNGHIAFFVLFFVTYVISLFFWPTPAVPLIGAILIPVAIRVGLPAIGAAIAISFAGQGMALSSDFIIQIAPTINATAGNLSVTAVSEKAFILSIITGGVAITLAYLMIRKQIKQPDAQHLKAWEGESVQKEERIVSTKGKRFAIIVPIVFFLVVLYMGIGKFAGIEGMEGGDGAALIGGVALLLLIATTMTHQMKTSLENVSRYIVDGFVFAFKAMGVVIPIAGFFFLGNEETAAQILQVEQDAPAFLFDLILSVDQYIPNSSLLAAISMLIVGMITGLDGSGFSGLPLTGALSAPLGTAAGVDPETLAAIGQMGAIWVGGGTLIAWSSLIAVAGFAKVSVMDLVRKSFLPVILGLLISTILAVFLL